MSKSKKKTPISGNCSGSEKKDKRLANRSFRRTIKTKLFDDIEILPELKEVSNIWSFDKDGKHWYGDCNEEDVKKWSRK